MNVADRYIANKLFREKLLLSDGNAYEQLFTEIMTLRYSDFKQVKPQGRYGDMACDGYSLAEGLFCQVYAPEDLSKNDDECEKKLEHDFNRQFEWWTSQGFTIQKFRYVINDKYKSVGPITHARIQSLRLQHPEMDIQIWTAVDVERLFDELSSTDKEHIIGFVPTPSAALCEIAALNDVTNHLISIHITPSMETIPMSVNMENKIRFNHLGADAERFLHNGLAYSGLVEEFFDNNNFEQREILRGKFNGLYQEALQAIPDEENNSDEVFAYIYKKACPDPLTDPIDTAVRALMAYYFEACDIFKIPE